MELYFGVAGAPGRLDHTLRQLAAFSQQSNPGIALRCVDHAGLRMGCAARHFSVWPRDEAGESGPRLYLNGYFFEIDGQPTTPGGSVEEELAQVARLYERLGMGIWERLDGNFCLFIQDGVTLHIGVDAVGTRTCYWWAHEGVLAFHTHLMDLAPSYPAALSVDVAALGNVLACGVFPPTRTPYVEVAQLLPGSALTFADGQVQIERHFTGVATEPYAHVRAQDLVDELATLLTDSVSRCWRSADRPVVPLSGGADSRYIAAELTRVVPDRAYIHTITWGEDPARPQSDAVVARQVVEALGVENEWHEKSCQYLESDWRRAIYLSSGGADAAVQYPSDHVLHAELVSRSGFRALFRGDELYDSRAPLLTNQSLPGVLSIGRLSFGEGLYTRWVDPGLVHQMAQRQASLLTHLLQTLRSETRNTRRDELVYQFQFPQWQGVYNRIKHADLEVFNPHMGRRVLEWTTRVPDRLRNDKRLLREALRQRHPVAAAVPSAVTSNHPDWERNFLRDPRFARLYLALAEAPGWLDGVAEKRLIARDLHAIERNAARLDQASASGGIERRHARSILAMPSAEWKSWAKRTRPGKIYLEWVMERHLIEQMPSYVRWGRLMTLHSLMGPIASRHTIAHAGAHPAVVD